MTRQPAPTIREDTLRRHSDQGIVQLKTILALLLIGVAGFLLYKTAPPYFANGQIADKIRDEARFAQANDRTPEQVRARILREALLLEIPLEPDSIQIFMDANGTHITADYAVTVDLYYHQIDWAFHIDSDR